MDRVSLYFAVAILLIAPACTQYKKIMGDENDASSDPVRYPSSVQIAWTDQEVYDALTWDQKNLLDKTAPFFNQGRYDVSYKFAYQKFLDGTGPNIFPEWFTDEQFRRVLIALINLGKLDGLTYI